MQEKYTVILTGALFGLMAVLLVLMGNPANMGFCIACFLRDVAGGLGLHRAAAVQYLRPEIMGLVLGAFLSALKFREFKSRGGSGVLLRFTLGAFMMMGALIFLGCPLRMFIRIAGGDLNALAALPGYIFGIWVGTLFLKQGYTLGQATEQPRANGLVGTALSLGLLLAVLTAPAFIFFSAEGPGSMRAPLFVSLAAGLLGGFLAQRSRLCTMGAFRDLLLFRDYHLFSGMAALVVVTLAGNLLFGFFNPGFSGQPIAHTQAIWNFLGMGIVGLTAVLAGGCPLRQLILTGEGNADAFATILGSLFGAAVMHNFNWAASPHGVSAGGQAMVVAVWLLLLLIGFAVTRQALKKGEERAQKFPQTSKGKLQ